MSGQHQEPTDDEIEAYLRSRHGLDDTEESGLDSHPLQRPDKDSLLPTDPNDELIGTTPKLIQDVLEQSTFAKDIHGNLPETIERNLCLRLLAINDLHHEVASLVEPLHFESKKYATWFRLISQSLDQGDPIDHTLLCTKLVDLNLSGLGIEPAARLSVDIQMSVASFQAEGVKLGEELINTTVLYARQIRDRWTIKQLQFTLDVLAAQARKTAPDSLESFSSLVLDRLEATLQGNSRRKSGPRHLDEFCAEVLDQIEQNQIRKEQGVEMVSGQTTGIAALDDITGGLSDGDLIIIAGRPSMGKSTLAVNILENILILNQETKPPMLLFTLEMSGTDMAYRMIASQGRIDQTKLRRADLQDWDYPNLSNALEKMSQSNFYIDDTSSLTIQEIKQRARKMHKSKGGLRLIAIDYLQLISTTGLNRGNQTEDISAISRSLKELARELECPVIALSQLNRSLEQRANKRPIMSDLRSSGAIEQDADKIWFVYRDEVYNPDTPDRGTAEVIVGKNRNGPLGIARVGFNGAQSRFEHVDGLYPSSGDDY